MCKYTVFKIWTGACLLSLIGFQTVASAGSDGGRVKENINTLLKTKSCPGCDLSGAELNRMDLSGVNLQGADLTGAKLFLTNLSGANLQNTHLQKAIFGGADMAGADLRGADLSEADLSGAYLVDTKFDKEPINNIPYIEGSSSETEKITKEKDSVKPEKNNENQSVSVNGIIDHQETKIADQKKVETAGNDSDRTRLKKDTKLIPEEKADPKAFQMKHAAIDNKEVETVAQPVAAVQPIKKIVAEEKKGSINNNTDNKHSPAIAPEQGQTVAEKDLLIANPAIKEKDKKIVVAKPEEISSDKAKNLKRLLETKKCYKCDLAGVDLSGKDLENADLEGANLTGSNLEKTDLSNANLKGAMLVDANLKKVNMNGTDLYKANLSGADLTDAKMEKAKVDETLFVGATGRHM